MRTRALALTAALAAAVPTSLHADDALRPEQIPNKARQLADRGRAAHDLGDYQTAIAAFEEAYVLAPSPGLLFNIAQAYRLAGHCDEAAWMYRRFLDTKPRGNERALAETHLRTVEKCGTGGLRTSPPAPNDADVPAPRLARTSDRDRAPARSVTYKRAGIGAAIGGGVLVAGAVLFALDARNAADTVERAYQRGGKWADVAEANARGERSASLATTLAIGGGLAVTSGAVLYAVGRHYEKARHVAVVPTGRGAQVSWTWSF